MSDGHVIAAIKGAAAGIAIAFVVVPASCVAAIGIIKLTAWLIHVLYGSGI